MKTSLRFLAGALLSLCLAGLHVMAQQGGAMGGPQLGSDAAFLKLFQNFKGFSAKVEISIEAPNHPPMRLPASMEFGEQKARVDIDLSLMQSEEIPPGAMEQFKAMGMAVLYTISLVEKNEVYAIYPDLKAYTRMPVPKEPKVETSPNALKTEELGVERVGGLECLKRRITVKIEGGRERSFLVWASKELKEFPVKVDMVQDGAHVVMQYSQVKLEAPAAARFAIPTGFKSYPSVQELMQTEMMKRMGAMPGQ